MRYVVLRDDDTNALTPPEYLDRLYRPFLDQRLPVNLAVIPEVATNTTMADGSPEGYLVCKNGQTDLKIPIGTNPKLVHYLLENPDYHVLQHGCYHDRFEFDCHSSQQILGRLQHGTWRLMEAGFPRPDTFVAPYDKISRESMQAVARRFRAVSTGWYELRRLPFSWWPLYLLKKLRRNRHWRVGKTLLFSHPGCLLSYHRSLREMLDGIVRYSTEEHLTVLVTHWWEYFREGRPDEPFIEFLHQTASYLASHPAIKVISFTDLVKQRFPSN